MRSTLPPSSAGDDGDAAELLPKLYLRKPHRDHDLTQRALPGMRSQRLHEMPVGVAPPVEEQPPERAEAIRGRRLARYSDDRARSRFPLFFPGLPVLTYTMAAHHFF